MTILVAGGAGYIGSHTCVVLLEAGYDLVVADNLSNSRKETIDRIKKITGKDFVFYKIDLRDVEKVEELFINHHLDGVMHFAGYKAVGESVYKPLDYYYNNLVTTMVLSMACIKHKVNKFIFSSSATVYGN
ncbi:MAG TPA: SDR family NAD(P)-dependent oxidoreductase, partial [Defluviitaleaceae bacterium]|nr:SDR family NAD(P)-dependent oxidoreductase [Defluviitaleaceae bacterium]